MANKKGVSTRMIESHRENLEKLQVKPRIGVVI